MDKIPENHVFGNNEGPLEIKGVLFEIPKDGSVYQDCVKLSNAHDVYIYGCDIHGGTEDCIDMNRGCTRIDIENCSLWSGGRYCLTIKDAHDVVIKDTVIHVHGKEADIDLGNWTDTSTRKTTKVLLRNVRGADGKPVKVRVGNADWPEIRGGNCKIDYIGSYLLKAYWYAKYLLVQITK